MDKRLTAYDTYHGLLIHDLRRWLTDLEFETVYLIYFLNFTPGEIALHKHISVQAVNKTKNRALCKLRARMKGS